MPKSARTATCLPGDRTGRLAQARGFWRNAEDLSALGADHLNSIVALYVNSGIASADVVCCSRLGEFSQSQNHADAIQLLKRAEPSLASALSRLLGRKSADVYGASVASHQRVTEARNAAAKLLRAAERL